MKSRDDGGSPIADRTVSSGHDGTNNDNVDDDNECCFLPFRSYTCIVVLVRKQLRLPSLKRGPNITLLPTIAHTTR